ncbi:L-ectoine synthase [Streptomyces dioscori]|uniref:L-ectoine synthase n=1 Tax=Streptomyces dioscori TaxID=2109333 RepID=A0A2P8Q0J7_9ACTN|nr:ectoine synthase [Streptomyces dioscori]PSM39772.1 L-ectoine synthase [Streptomyces dioscori]
MLIRTKEEALVVEWGNGLSHRLLLQADRMGFSFCHTVVRAGTKSRLEYRRHLEACYCITGRGWISLPDGSATHELRPGVLYALDQHDAHFLTAAPDADLELISVFNPPLQGGERHNLDQDEFSHY